MRLWSFHPKHLNRQYLGACWYEGITKAQTGLQGGGYKNHSQLQRFKNGLSYQEFLHNQDCPFKRNCPFKRTCQDDKPEFCGCYNDYRAGYNPIMVLAQYLHAIWWESLVRNYSYDSSKIIGPLPVRLVRLPVTRGQLDYEWQHYLGKIEWNDPDWHIKSKDILVPQLHPMFYVVEGDIEDWERVKE